MFWSDCLPAVVIRYSNVLHRVIYHDVCYLGISIMLLDFNVVL